MRSFGPSDRRITEATQTMKPSSTQEHKAAEIPRSYTMFTRVTISVNPSTDAVKPRQTISFQSPVQPRLFVWLKAYSRALHLADVAINHRLALPLQLAAWQMFHNNCSPHPTLPVKRKKKRERVKETEKKNGAWNFYPAACNSFRTIVKSQPCQHRWKPEGS